MSFGCNTPVVGPAAAPDNILSIATKVDELGFDHIWVNDHIILPHSIAPRYPYSETGDPPFAREAPWCEPLAAMGFLAGCTKNVKIGALVLVIPYREPILTAKILSTLDFMSNGRIILGAGVGWMEEEFKTLGLDTFRQRGRVTDEYLDIFKELWTSDNPSFQGRYASFSDIHFYPKPIQKPHIPIWIGGNEPPAIRRAARIGDAWLPTTQLMSMEEIADKIALLRQEVEKAGRPAGSVSVSRSIRRGDSAQDTRDEIARSREIGIEHFILGLFTQDISAYHDGVDWFANEVMPYVD